MYVYPHVRAVTTGGAELLQYVRSKTSSTRETLFDVESVTVKKRLLHDVVDENGAGRTRRRSVWLTPDEFGLFLVKDSGINRHVSRHSRIHCMAF